MSASADEYLPVACAAKFRRQAFRVWGLTLFAVLLWVGLILAAPILKANGSSAAADIIYRAFGFLCHQIDSRSFHIDGERLAVCTRCFGVYAGLAAGIAFYPLIRRVDDIEPLPKLWLLLSVVPAAIDWSLTIFGIWENTAVSRTLTGAILGIGCGIYIVPAVVEIARNLSYRRRVSAK